MLTITAAARPLWVMTRGSREAVSRFTIAVAPCRRSVIGMMFGILGIINTSYNSINDTSNCTEKQHSELVF
jgi:hypothetical protein